MFVTYSYYSPHPLYLLIRSLVCSLYRLQQFHWASSLVRRGIQYARDGRYSAAIEQYDAALSNVENYVDALVARGAAQANLVNNFLI